MEQLENNPNGNRLGPSINEPNLVRAIKTSGYPLQGIVADKLKETFAVSEEWGYLDRDTKEHRSLDLFAYRKLPDEDRIYPAAVLLIECKRSINPYVFFTNVVERDIPRFPRISGLTYQSVSLQEKGTNRTLQSTAGAVLGLLDQSFVRPGPPRCSAFAMAMVQGDKVNLSGQEPYNSLILPLVKAIDHTNSLYIAHEAPPPHRVLYPTMILAIGVLDAPMLVVREPTKAEPMLAPWVRVPRQEARSDHRQISNVHYVVDMVHADFLDAFLTLHLTPFLNEFASRAAGQSAVLQAGGEVESLDNWKWDLIKPR